MIKSLAIAVRNRLSEPVRRFVHWLCFGSSGIWITALVVVLVGGRFLWLWSQHPRRIAIAEAFGSVGYLYGTPQSTRSGDQITYVQTTANGVGLFVCDTVTGERQLVFEEKGSEKYGAQDFTAWPWSPDDKLFLYTRGSIAICQGNTREVLAKIGVGKQPVKSLVWLAPDKFAYASPDGSLHMVNRQKGGKWQPSEVAGVKVGSSSLTALSSNTIAWNRADCIWTMNLDSKAVSLLYQSPASQTLDTFACSKDTGKFLLKLRQALPTGTSASLWQMLPGNAPVKLAACPPTAGAISWLNASNGSCAYLCPKSANAIDHVLTLQSKSSSESSKLFSHGTADTFTPTTDGKHFFIVGVVSNEPAEGIWQYDITSENLQCVVPCSAHPSPYAHHVEALHDTLKLASGRKVDYFLYAPVNFNRQQHKKYPLVIGDTVYQIADAEHQGRVHGPLWAEALACCDAYVVIVDRASWFGGLDQWEENVTEVYKHLAHNPSIDKDQVFLFGASAETSPLSILVQDRPELWKGLLLLNPSGLPRLAEIPSGMPVPRILISSGKGENREDSFKRYQAEARQNGVPVDVVIHSNSTHWLVSIDALQERTKAMVDFIFNN